MSEIATYIEQQSDNTLSADSKSLYRSLRRYYDMDMIEYSLKAGNKGPQLKIYKLSPIGEKLLPVFVNRNIFQLLNNKEIKGVIG